MNEMPLFSIIVVSYNASVLIKKTIESVINQRFTDYEIIVKDANSTDDTIEQIPNSSKLRIIQTKDSGIYDGMNQAVIMAKGSYLLFLNCGDTFASDDVLKRISELVDVSNKPGDIIYGDCIMNGMYKKQPSTLSSFFLYRTPLCHQSIFFSREIFTQHGLYDLNYKILADYNCTLNAYRQGVKFYYVNMPICIYLGGGVSESQQGIVIKKQEYELIHKKYYSGKERFLYEFMLTLSFRKVRYYMFSDKSPRILRQVYQWLVNLVNR